MIFIWIYLACVAIIVGLLIFNNNPFSIEEKNMLVLLAPIMVIVMLVEVKEIYKNGVKSFFQSLKDLDTYETDEDGMDFYSDEELAKMDEEVTDNSDLEKRNNQT